MSRKRKKRENRTRETLRKLLRHVFQGEELNRIIEDTVIKMRNG